MFHVICFTCLAADCRQYIQCETMFAFHNWLCFQIHRRQALIVKLKCARFLSLSRVPPRRACFCVCASVTEMYTHDESVKFGKLTSISFHPSVRTPLTIFICFLSIEFKPTTTC